MREYLHDIGDPFPTRTGRWRHRRTWLLGRLVLQFEWYFWRVRSGVTGWERVWVDADEDDAALHPDVVSGLIATEKD